MFDNEELMGKLLNNAWKISKMPEPKRELKEEISPNEALEIYKEFIQVMERHNVSYKVGCRLSIALTEAMLAGAVELYRQENS